MAFNRHSAVVIKNENGDIVAMAQNEQLAWLQLTKELNAYFTFRDRGFTAEMVFFTTEK